MSGGAGNSNTEAGSGELFRALIESTSDPIWSVDLDFRLVTFNRALYDIVKTGFGVEIAAGMRSEEIVPPETAARWPAYYRRAVAEGGFRGEFVLEDGRRFEAAVNLTRQSGEITGISVFGKDITERRATEKRLQEAEQQYRHIFEGALEGIYRTAADGRSLTANPALAAALGYDSVDQYLAEMTDSGRQVWLDPEERLRYLRLLEKNGVVRGFECLLKRRDGTPVWVSLNGRKVSGADGRLLYSEGFLEDISARKLAEEALRESDERHRTILLTAMDGFWLADLQGRLLEVNQAYCRMSGYSAEELLRLRISDLEDEESDRDTEAHMQTVAALGQDRFESRHRRKDGSIFEVEVSVNYQPLDGGRMVAFLRDVTGRKRAERALLQSDRKFATAFRSNPAMMALFRPDGGGNTILDVNAAFEEVTGYRREDVIGQTSQALRLWADAEELARGMKLLEADGGVRNFEYRLRCKGGEIRTGLLSTERIELDGKQCAISTTIDITELKKSEAAMASLSIAIEHAEEQIIVTDTEGVIRYCNPAVEKVTGYSREQLLGQNPRLLKSGKHGPEFYAELWTTLNQNKVWRGHLINKKQDGSFYEEEATISPISDGFGHTTGFVAVKRDVTERLHLEQQFRQAQKLESVGRLAGGVAHDFNNMLTVINGYSGMMLDRLHATDPLRAFTEQINKAGERAAGLTRQLLAFSRKQVIEPRATNLNVIVGECVPMLQRLIGENIEVVTKLDAALGLVMAAPDQFHQVIMNLAVNARDAMSDGGRLAIGTANVELDEGAQGRHPGLQPGRYVVITVTDSGSGMDESTRLHMFEPFFTTKESGKGTGLGLSTVYGIVSQSGGVIDVWSEVGSGTSFQIYLPRIEAAPAPERVESVVAVAGGGETVLLVEDQEAVRALTKEVLQRHGYRILEASGGEEAIAMARQYAGDIDLLLTDVMLEGMNGRKLAELLTATRPTIKVLFVSGYTAEVIANRGVLESGIAFLQKPFSADGLTAKVREVLARSRQ